MSNPQPTNLTWEDHQTLVTTLLNGQSVDQTLLTQLLNDSRDNFESDREWQVLKNVDQSVTWSPSDTWQTAKTLPANFKRWVERNPIQAWNGDSVNPIIIPVNIIPFEDRLWHYSDNYLAAVDYANNLFYMMGTSDQTYTLLLSFIQENGDLVPSSQNNNVATYWMGFRARFHKALSFDVAARYRLGVSYDDLAARNADQNYQDGQRVLASMRKWDAGLNRSNLKNMDYYPEDYPSYTLHKINTR